jgi:hypothetical protein
VEMLGGAWAGRGELADRSGADFCFGNLTCKRDIIFDHSFTDIS